MVTPKHYEKRTSVPENPYAKLIPDQTIAIIPSFTLESGTVLQNVPVAYKSWGKLSPEADNAMVVCHALSGSSDVSDWWGPLLGGKGRAFDATRFFIICINSLGSPYGTCSPVTYVNGQEKEGRYGPEFPLTTIRDDVRLSKMLLDDLGVKQVAAVVGGSMGGMAALEWAYLGKHFVKTVVAIATSARHSAWGISWGELQRQAIYEDANYEDGYYDLDNPPYGGLGNARGQALLTYRSRDSFETRFGYKAQPQLNDKRPVSPQHQHYAIHNEGHKRAGPPRSHTNSISEAESPSLGATQTNGNGENDIVFLDPQFNGATPQKAEIAPSSKPRPHTHFAAQSYLRYQKEKFVKRFDANCYIAITRKLDTHDVSVHWPDQDDSNKLHNALTLIEQPTLVLGIGSDGLFTFNEQEIIAKGIPDSRLEKIESPEGHDAFLLQFQQVNNYVLEFLNAKLPEIMARKGISVVGMEDSGDGSVGKITKSSTFGEAEAEDMTAW